MVLFIRLFTESFLFAVSALRENLLRTILSLLGVTVGIFAIIAVLTLVDTLDKSIKKSLSFLGSNVLYVEKWPWLFEDNYPWWKYYNRPYPTYEEYVYLQNNLTWAQAVSIYDQKGGAVLKYRNNSIGDADVIGASYTHNQVGDFEVEQGRYFSPQEADKAKNVVVIGTNIAESLFGQAEPLGKILKIKGIKFQVIGLLKKKGENLLDAPSNDDIAIIPFKSLMKMYASRSRGISPTIAIKGKADDKDLIEVENEAKGLLRGFRGLRPIEDDSFAMNRPEAIASVLDGIISVLTIAGWCIGSFSILVGGFGIANIMFVSVKERTNLIGIQKSLGAKNYFILLQFLFESIFLSFLGGATGLLLVNFLALFSTETFVISLSFKNIVLGMSVSLLIGIISGLIPAVSASRMDPVIAIRSK
ncbi:ABC transporter permease [Chondrinema litorale]|uniref:ABC transporter permease n=1 Tax=Chondrinema litorale TaxID=2994555 RepID=UPI002543AF10|nr:ABC transporter permease [Chondrinema litorale]UZR92261.1 ABC transporter permease [Chondrinema litorale]